MPNNILITPGSASIQFSGSAANNLSLQVLSDGDVTITGSIGRVIEFSNTGQVFVTSSVIASSFTGSLFGTASNAVSSSFATNANLALTANTASYVLPSGLPNGTVSSSLQFNNTSLPFTGSFTGSFTGPVNGTATNATNFDGVGSVSYASALRANRNVMGGGTITVDASSYVYWSTRFIVISNTRGTNFSINGYFDINCPTAGTITGVGGATNKTATVAGIPLAPWEALYYILPIGSGNVSLDANFRVASYTANVDIPYNWILLCVRNGDNNVFYFNNGIKLKLGESLNQATHDARNADLLDGYNQDTANTANAIVRRDGSGNFSAGRIDAASLYDINNTNYYIDPAGTTSLVAAGDVVIGATTPAARLHVDGGANLPVRLVSTGFSGIEYHNPNGTWKVYIGTETGGVGARYNVADSIHNWYNNSTFAMRLNAVGLGINTNDPQNLLHISGVGQRNGFQINTVKTYVTERLTASATQARQFEIARIGIDFNDWNSVGTFMVELFEVYYSRGVYKRYQVSYGYNNNSYSCDLVEYNGTGDNHARVTVGTPVLVTGDQYYLPVYVEVRFYAHYDVRIQTNRNITTTSTPPIGTTYINLNPTAVNISDFTADSEVKLAPQGNAYILGNLGLGTSPSVKLHVLGSSILANNTTIDPDSYLNYVVAGTIADGSGWNAVGIGGNTGTGGSWGIAHTGGALYFGMQNGSAVNTMQTYIRFASNRNLYLVETSGNVGIGTTSPATPLDVSGGTAGTGGWNRTATLTATYPILLFNSNGTKWAGIGYDYSTAMRIWVNSNNNNVSANTSIVTIANTGRVGIGAETPDSLLHIQSASNAIVRIDSTNAVNNAELKLSYNTSDSHGMTLRYNGNNALAYIDNTYPRTSGQVYGDIYFRQNINGTMTPRMMIQAQTGNVGIGTTSPSTLLDVAGQISMHDEAQDLDNRYYGATFLRGWSGFNGGSESNITYTTDTTSPVGLEVLSVNTYVWARGPRIRLDKNQNYEVEFWVKRQTANTAATLYFVVSNYDASGNVISGDGSDWNYPTSVSQASLVVGTWYKYRFVVGPYGGQKDHNVNARYIGVGFIANYTSGTDVLYFTGFKCRPISQYSNDAITVTNAGNVSIGTTTNSHRLHVNGTGFASSDFRAPIFYDSDNTVYKIDGLSTSVLNILDIRGYQWIVGQTINGQSHYQWEGATYRDPGTYTSRLIVRQDNSSTGINGFMPSLVVYNNNGGDQTTAGIVFASAEGATGAGNSVNLAGIIAKKESAGNVNAWSAGSLTFFVKNFGNRVDAMHLGSTGLVGVGTTSPTHRLQLITNSTLALPVGYEYVPSSWAREMGGIILAGSQVSDGSSGWRYGSRIMTRDYGDGLGASWDTLYNGTWTNDVLFISGRVNRVGYVGIGTTAPGSKLTITAASAASIPALGTQTNNQFSVLGDSAAYGVLLGVLGSGNVYQQVGRVDANATAYDLLLQPNGGNVAIGYASAGYRLDVQGGSVRIGVGTYEANLLFGNNQATWGSGIRVFDNADAEMRIWHRNARGQVILAVGYLGDNSTTLPTDGIFLVGDTGGTGPAIKVGVGYTAANIRGGTAKLAVNGNVAIGTTSANANLVVYGGEGTYNAPTFGSGNRGAIQIRNLTSDRRNAITFSSANSDNAQAGIYVHQDNGAGTHMYFATTDSYATGPQSRVTILNTGNVGINVSVPTRNLDINGDVRMMRGSNPINFTSAWSSTPDAVTNVSEISNDTSGYQTLMIIGNKSAGSGNRRVGIWDQLSINGATYSHAFNVNGTGLATTDFRAPIFRDSVDTNFYLDPASTTTSLQIAGAIEQGNNLARPLVQWGATSATGAVVIKLPGGIGNYGMIHAVIDIYEYNSNNVCTVIVGGHNWNGAWYNIGAQVVGFTNKPVRLAFKDGQYAIVIGNSASTWDYGQVVLRKIQNATFYNNVMDLGGTYSIAIEADSYTWVSSDLRGFRTVGTMTVSGDIYANAFYDNDNAAYYINPAGGNARIGRDLYVEGFTGGNFGNRIIVGAAGAPYTLQDGNIRPTVYLRGNYPVLTLDHTVTGNTDHGPTIQFVYDGLSSRQWLIGTSGDGTKFDMGYSDSGQGNSNFNPHNGIAGYLGVTWLTVRRDTGRIGLGWEGDWGTYGTNNSPSSPFHFIGSHQNSHTYLFRNTTNASNGAGALFVNTYGNHSWGIVAEYRIEANGGSDRPSILFSSGYNTTTWSVGYGYSDDNFRISQNHGHRNGQWGTTRFYINTSGEIYVDGLLQSNGSLRAPIFIDSVDNFWRLDPNSFSRLWSVQARNLGGANLQIVSTNIGVNAVLEAITFIDGTIVQAHASTGNGNPGNCYNWYSSETVQIDPEKDYEFSVWVRSTGNDNIYFGWHEYDVNGGFIGANPYFHTSPRNTNGTWIQLRAILRSWRTPANIGDSNGSDRYANATSENFIWGGDGVLHSATRFVLVRFGTCYGSVNGSKTYYHGLRVREIGHENMSNQYTVPYYNGSTIQGRMRWRTMTHWDNVSGIDIIGAGGEFRMSADSGDLNLRVDGWVQSHTAMYAPIYYDQVNSFYRIDGDSNSQLLNLGLGGVTPDIRLSVSGDTHISNYLYLGGTAGSVGSWGTRTIGTSGYWTTNAREFTFNNVGYGSSWSVVFNSAGRIFYDNYIVSRNSGGLMGDYNQTSTASKVIWTIGESWPIGNMYGLGYEYGSGYDHHLALRNNGVTYSRFGFAGGAFIGGNVTAGGQMIATSFADATDNSYVMDPYSISNWNGLTDFGKMRIGLTGKAGSNWRRNDYYGGDTNYWTGVMGYGTTDLNTVMTWGSGFFDTWSSPGNSPGDTSHYVGVQAYHYVSAANSGYGWQMMGGVNGSLWWRHSWPNNSGWYKIAMYENNTNADRYFYANRFVAASNTGYFVVPNSFSQLSSGYSDSYWRSLRYYFGGEGGNSGVGTEAYALFQEGGAWSFPYPDLRIAYHVGIKMGALSGYEGMRFYTDYDMSSIVWQFNGSNNYAFQYTWTNLTGYHGMYSGINGAHIYPNDATYGSWRMNGSRNGWNGIYFDSGVTLMMNGNEHGFHTNTWTFRVFVGSGHFPGDVIAYWSDKRLKENIRPLEAGEGLDIISRLVPSRFTWKKEAALVSETIPVGTEEVSVIAQETQQVLPSAVRTNLTGKKISIDESELTEYLTINYDKISPYLIAAIKDLKMEIEALKLQLAQRE